MISKQQLLVILKSKYTAFIVSGVLLLFLFKGIVDTYAYTDGYEFLFNSTNTNFLEVFLQQGRTVSGLIIKLIYPYLNHVNDLSYLRVFNLICLALSCILIYRMLMRNNISAFHSLVIISVFICSPFSSIVVQWEAASSCIWGYPVALLSGELIFTALLNKDTIEKKRFNLTVFTGTLLGIISLFIYQPDFTVFIFPAFLHFITGQKRDVIWSYLLRNFMIYGIYFLLFKFELNQLHIPPNERAGIVLSPNKLIWFVKGAFLMSLHHNIIFASNDIIKLIIAVSLLLMGYFIYSATKNSTNKNKWSFVFILFMFYLLAYLPSLIAVDNWISYRTMGTVTLLSSTLLVCSIGSLPLKAIYKDVVISIIVIAFITVAYQNNKTFTEVACREYNAVKAVITEKLKEGYPKNVMVIMPEEKFLVQQKLITRVVTDEFGKLSNSVDWAPEFFVKQLVYELMNDKPKTQAINITRYLRAEMPADSIVRKNDWVLDIEQIYLSKNDEMFAKDIQIKIKH